jgi:cobalt-zinc-cadmium efflux system outer membrane protein
MRRELWAACACALLVAVRADGQALPAPCAEPLRAPATIAACAVAQSVDVKSARLTLRALAGRRRAAAVLLPSHPNLAVNLAERQMPADVAAGGQYLNWYVTLSQELEVAGQRGARLLTVEAEQAAQLRRVAVAEQEAAATALAAYYQLLGAREEVRLGEMLGSIADTLARLASARVAVALAAPVDADVAAAEASRLGLLRIEAAQRVQSAEQALRTLLGLDPLAPAAIAGAWPPAPLRGEATAPAEADEIERALLLRGEVAAAHMEQVARARQLQLVQRSRAPNLTLSLYAQRDGQGERVLGGGVSLPLPLPAPLGPSRRGEIEEASAQIELAGTTLAGVRRRVRLEVAQAVAGERAQEAAVALFPPPLITRAEQDLRALAQAVATQRLLLREALLAQRSLIELLQAHVRAQLALALARVERQRAGGRLLAEALP